MSRKTNDGEYSFEANFHRCDRILSCLGQIAFQRIVFNRNDFGLGLLAWLPKGLAPPCPPPAPPGWACTPIHKACGMGQGGPTEMGPRL